MRSSDEPSRAIAAGARRAGRAARPAWPRARRPRSRRARASSSTRGSTLPYAPTAPDSLPTREPLQGRGASRSCPRSSSSTQPSSFSPNVVGSACTPWCAPCTASSGAPRPRQRRVARALDARQQQAAGVAELQRERGVDDVRRGEPVVEPARVLADLLGDRLREGDDVVVRAPLDLLRAGDVDARAGADRLHASAGTTPSSAHASSAASSTSSQLARRRSSVQTAPMSGRV